MATRLPKANTWFNHYKDSQLATIAQAISDGLNALALTFPDLPFPIVGLNGLITAYVAALAASIDGSKQQTAAKNAAKIQLQNALRLNCKYVNQVVYKQVAAGATYDAAQDLILQTGYQLQKDPQPFGDLPQVEIKTYSSPKPGQLYILAVPISGAKGYQVDYWFTGDDRDTAKTFASGSSRINIFGLQSARSYTFTVLPIGANNTSRIESNYKSQVII